LSRVVSTSRQLLWKHTLWARSARSAIFPVILGFPCLGTGVLGWGSLATLPRVYHIIYMHIYSIHDGTNRTFRMSMLYTVYIPTICVFWGNIRSRYRARQPPLLQFDPSPAFAGPQRQQTMSKSDHNERHEFWEHGIPAGV
jgi:hypothetical protein